jgi:hypothetical protein
LSSILLGFLWSIASCFPRPGGYVAESYPPIYYDVYGTPFPWFFYKIQSGVINIDIDYLLSLGILNIIFWSCVFYTHITGRKRLFFVWGAMGALILIMFNYLLLNLFGIIYFIILYALTTGIKLESK